MKINNITDNFRASKKVNKKPTGKSTISKFCTISDEVKAKAVEMRLKLMRLVDIASELGISTAVVNACCIKALGKEKHTEISNQIRKSNQNETGKEVAFRQEKIKGLLLNDGSLSNKKIADLLGVASSVIDKDVRKMIDFGVLVKSDCCGVSLLNIEREGFIKRIKTLESEKTFLEHQLNNAINKIISGKNER